MTDTEEERPGPDRPGMPPLVSGRRRLSVLIGDRRRTVVLLAACSALSGATESAILVLIAQVAVATAKGSTKVPKVSFLHVHGSPSRLLVYAFGLTLLRVALQIPLATLPARIAAAVQARLRREMFEVFTRASWAVQSRDREGHFQELMSGQVTQASGAALQATQLVVSFFTFIVLMVSALYLNAIAATIILVAALGLFGLLRPLNRLATRLSRELSQAQLAYAGGISEAGRMAEETHVFAAEAAQRGRIDRLIAVAQDLYFRTAFVSRLSPSLYQSAVLLIIVGGLYALVKLESAHFASLGAVVLIIVRVGQYGQQVQGAYQGIRTSLPYVDRLQAAARRYADSIEPDGELELEGVRSIAFEHVSFGYHAERPVLEDLSFEVPAGEAIGVIGPSGAGKSTLIQILLQLRRADSGAYLVNDRPVEEFRRADWYSRVSYVPQAPRLLHASVIDNIRFLRDIDDEDVHRAAQLARIHDDILSWPEGYETTIGPRVDAVSGGQQQRICLARALAGRPEVLVLDEPTSALDPQSERLIQASLQGLRHEMTLFIIAHRMSTLDICDRVMVIVDGRLAAFDSIELLQQNNSYYQSASLLAAGAPGGSLP